MSTICKPLVQPFARAAERIARIPITLSIATAALLVALNPAVAPLLQFERSAIVAGEVWRLLTCHLVHWNAEHLQWDLLMLVVLGAACELRSERRMAVCIAASAVTVSLTVLLRFPTIATYRGLSGLDTALFVLLAVDLLAHAWRERNILLSLATGGLLAALAVKTGYEAITGRTMFVDVAAAGFVPIVLDHIAGAAVGLGVALMGVLPSVAQRTRAGQRVGGQAPVEIRHFGR